MKYEIKKKVAKPFKGSEGDMVDYFWYTATRGDDGVTIQFGSVQGDYGEGEMYDLDLQKVERANGKIGYRDITP